jgi:hypothetical protein
MAPKLATLPVEQPNTSALGIDLKTADALVLVIPQALLLCATSMFEVGTPLYAPVSRRKPPVVSGSLWPAA